MTARAALAAAKRSAAGPFFLTLCFLLQACASPIPSPLASPLASPRSEIARRVTALLPADVLLFGEQHDAPEHHQLERALVLELAQRGQLAALVIEMAEQGHDTSGLGRDASEAAVQQALAWNDAGWPWQDYGPVVMAAVRNAVPVLGANLGREGMRAAMGRTVLDAHLDAASLAEQQENIRQGHCLLLPESQIAPMTRIQIARDAAMADTLARATQPGKTVLLVAGGGHVLRGLGVPTHLPAPLRTRVVLAVAGTGASSKPSNVDFVWETPPVPPVDRCVELRRPRVN